MCAQRLACVLKGLPPCTESNVGQAIAHRWYRQFYKPSRVDYQEF